MCERVFCLDPIVLQRLEETLGPVVAVSRWKGQLRVMIRGWGRWYPVESVRIERMVVSSSR